SRSPRTLLVVESHGRHIGEHHRLQAAYVDSYFHSRRHAQQVNGIDQLDYRMCRILVNVDHYVSELALPFSLVIRLCGELFAVKPYRLAEIESLHRVVIALQEISARGVRLLWQVVQTVRTHPSRVKVLASARWTHPNRIIWQSNADIERP